MYDKTKNKYGGNKHRKNAKYTNKDKFKKREKTIEEHEREYISKKRNMPGEKPVCPICEKEIYLVEQSIRHKDTGKPAHFDCILKELRENNEVDSSENIVYLGAGSFGIIKERHSRGTVKFFVRKRIIYEERENIKKEIDEDEEENL